MNLKFRSSKQLPPRTIPCCAFVYEDFDLKILIKSIRSMVLSVNTTKLLLIPFHYNTQIQKLLTNNRPEQG
ncbi:hypothetical protein JTE90_021097 [Oedothorax gibbosus]|uniref:Uncharacterized protein n=1 Tax=Oedothorax gibbosus TaxID=931172 RepID=A0AAV6TWA6_9ARAC|nr:hypothetical protein JTE90_021097 [Oedothorax gibbosus]